MNYQEFISAVFEQTNTLMEPTVKASIHKTLKNNSTKRIGITLSEESTNIFPTIYLEEFYDQYRQGRPIIDIVQNIARLYQEVKFDHTWDVGQVQDFSRAENRIAYKLIHYERNESLLETIPHIKFLDLAIVFYLHLEHTERGAATILITNDILQHWEITLGKLYHIALENTPNILFPELKSMRIVMQELLSQNSEDIYLPETSYMYVLSNHQRYYGAACILYENVLENIGEHLDDDYYILPSSIHEVIILPASCNMPKEEINEMIVTINDTHVSDEEILSDHAYYYSRSEKKLLQVL